MNDVDKEILKSAVPSLVFIAIFFLTYSILPGKGYYTIVFLMISMMSGAWLFRSIREGDNINLFKWFKSFIYTAIVVALFYFSAKHLGFLGVTLTIITIGTIVVIRLVKNRRMYMAGMRRIEEQVFGASLDKENWKKEKPKIPKVKL